VIRKFKLPKRIKNKLLKESKAWKRFARNNLSKNTTFSDFCRGSAYGVALAVQIIEEQDARN